MRQVAEWLTVGPLTALRYVALVVMALMGAVLPATTSAQDPTNSPWGPIVRTVAELPDGPLYWRLQTFETRQAAEAAVGPTGQVGEAEGLVWLFTIGRQGEAPTGGVLVAEIGPIEVPSAAEYTLGALYSIQPPGGASGYPGAVVHYHPGVESTYMLAGEQTTWTPGLLVRTEAGDSFIVPPGTTMMVVNTGRDERRAFALFVSDAAQPLTVPTVFQ